MTIDRWSPEYRRAHLGASQVPAALGVSPFTTPIELWQEYAGLVTRPAQLGPAARLGHALESGVAEVAAEILGVEIRKGHTLEDPRETWRVATPDFFTTDDATLQIKTSGLTSRAPAGVLDEWGEPGSDEVPVHVAVQVQVEMSIARATRIAQADHAYVAALLPGRGVQTYLVPFDSDVAQAIADKTRAFWSLVQSGTPPDPDESEAFGVYLSRRFPSPSGRWLEPTEAVENNVRAYLDARRRAEEAERDMRAARNQITMSIGDAQGYRGEGWSADWRGVRGNAEIDIDKARELLPSLIGEAQAQAVLDGARRVSYDRDAITEGVRGLFKTKREIDALIEQISRRGPGYRALYVTEKKGKK